MTLAEKIYKEVQGLTESAQVEILDFVHFIHSKKSDLSDSEWNRLSLSSALSDMENETFPEYLSTDLKEKFQ